MEVHIGDGAVTGLVQRGIDSVFETSVDRSVTKVLLWSSYEPAKLVRLLVSAIDDKKETDNLESEEIHPESESLDHLERGNLLPNMKVNIRSQIGM